MKTLYKILITGILAVIFGLFAQSNALAVDNLVVQFQSTPLFDEGNFNPGTSIDKWIKVTNNSGSAQNIAIEAINHPNPIPEYDLSRALDIVIKQGSADLYGGTKGNKTLYDFYDAGEILLSSLASGATTQYNIVIIFPEDKIDEWQASTTRFDILIGFQGTEGQGNGEQQSSGGGYVPPQGLVIINDQVTLTGVAQTTATFVWVTSHFSTSQIIYGSDTEAHTLNLSDTGNTPPKYGYAHTTDEFDITPKVTHHSVTVTGLTPNTTYYFRAVSHGSLAISGERTFKTIELAIINIGNIETGETTGGQGEIAGESTSSQQGNQNKPGGISGEVIPSGQSGEGTTTTTSTPPTFAAALGNIMSFVGSRAWLIVILVLIFIGIVYFLIWFFILKKRKKKEPPQQPFISKPVG